MNRIQALCALAAVGVLQGGAAAQVLFSDTFKDNSAGWSVYPHGAWAIGAATATPAGSPCPGVDPASDADGKPGGGLAGTVIGDCLQYLPSSDYFQSPPVDASGRANLRLEFDRRLRNSGTSSATVDVWTGSSWVNIFTAGPIFFDSAWTHCVYDVSAYANAAFKVRFGFMTASFAGGWSLDNVRISSKEYFFDRFRDNAAGWTLGPTWAIGSATASNGCVAWIGFFEDPAADADGITSGGIAGAAIGGCVGGPGHAQYYLTSPAVDVAAASMVQLSFDRFLSSDYIPYMNSVVEVFDGASWIGIFDTPASFADPSWVRAHYDVTAYKNAAFRVRFGYEADTAAYPVSGWNVDNVSICDPTVCGLGLSAHAGPGSIRVRATCISTSAPPGTSLFNCFTLAAGGYPNGFFLGISPSIENELVPQFVSATAPFRGITDAAGVMTWQVPAGVPAGITVYAVTLALDGASQVVASSPPTTFTTL